MQRNRQQERAVQFARLHDDEHPLVLVNAWDAVSASLLEQTGQRAIATTSAGMAWSLGYPDGERLGATELLAACERICRVVNAPVSVDIERGFGRTVGEVRAVARALIEMGVVGINIEDGVEPGSVELAAPHILAERVTAIRALAREMDVPLFINARVDTYFTSSVDGATRYDETLQRSRLYIAAGADGIFVPGLAGLDEIERLARTLPCPLNIYAGYEGAPAVEALQRAGVRRISLGCGAMQATLALLRRIATEALARGTYETMSAAMLSAREANALFEPPA